MLSILVFAILVINSWCNACWEITNP